MIKNFRELLEKAIKRGPKRIAVAGAEDADVLSAVIEARDQGIAEPLLTGSEQDIRSLASSFGLDLRDINVFGADNEGDAVGKAVGLVTSNRADLLMKGMVSTAEIVKAVLDRGAGLRTGRFLSHVMVYEIPGFQGPDPGIRSEIFFGVSREKAFVYNSWTVYTRLFWSNGLYFSRSQRRSFRDERKKPGGSR